MAEPGQSSRAAAPAEVDAIDQLRAEIDAIDDEILERLNRRAERVREIGGRKRERHEDVYAAGREKAIVERLRADNGGPFPDAGIAPVFREIVSATRSLEEVVRVAYLGPEGTFTHQAARTQFGSLATLCGEASIPEIFAAIEHGRVELGVVPVENTTEGVVTQTLDAFADSQVPICGELFLRISQQLLSKSGHIEDVRRVLSHPQPLAQCRVWLDRHLPGVERGQTPSTAAAAERAAADPSVAAIGSAIAAEVYGLATIEASIEDRSDNTTRFLVIGGEPPPKTGDDMTSVVFTTRRDEAGALFRLLQPFAEHGINLTSIHLRPIAGKPWEYLFFLDFDGHANDTPVAAALEEAGAIAHSHRVLGSFPRGRRETRR